MTSWRRHGEPAALTAAKPVQFQAGTFWKCHTPFLTPHAPCCSLSAVSLRNNATKSILNQIRKSKKKNQSRLAHLPSSFGLAHQSLKLINPLLSFGSFELNIKNNLL